VGKTINLIIVCFLLHLFGHYKVWKGISCYFHQKINTIKLNLPPRGKIALTRRTVLAELVQVGKTSNNHCPRTDDYLQLVKLPAETASLHSSICDLIY